MEFPINKNANRIQCQLLCSYSFTHCHQPQSNMEEEEVEDGSLRSRNQMNRVSCVELMIILSNCQLVNKIDLGYRFSKAILMMMMVVVKYHISN